MSDRFDLHLRYPELFEPLTEEQRRNVVQPLASSWLEGDNPTREDVALLIDYELGRITAEEYDRQALMKALAYQALTSQNAGSQNAVSRVQGRVNSHEPAAELGGVLLPRTLPARHAEQSGHQGPRGAFAL